MIISALTVLYLLAVAGLSLYGLLGLLTLILFFRHRRQTFACPDLPDDALPRVTVQLPVYNEKYVIGRLLEAAVRLDYPRHLLQIQVIDDSTDETTPLAAELIAGYRQQGIDISLHHRLNREGYKAGALEAALDRATGQFIAIFDADFQPLPDFLRRTIPHFSQDSGLGMIQARWGHLNAADSPLTAAQAIALDKHFAIEQLVRHRANLFPKFNGTAGIWRRRCLDEAGGWQDDTVCEDLCLSTRAILGGWRFRFLNDVVVPAELPASILAYKSQQARWAKGSLQCLIKFGRQIWCSDYSLPARLYALLSMSAYFAHPLLLLLLLLQIPLLYADLALADYLAFLGLAGIAQPLLFVLSQHNLYPDWPGRLRHLPALLLLAIGTAPSNSRALAELFAHKNHSFIRTPKTGSLDKFRNQHQSYRLPFDRLIAVEIALALYGLLGLWLALRQGRFDAVGLPAMCSLGFSYVALLGLRQHHRRQRSPVRHNATPITG